MTESFISFRNKLLVITSWSFLRLLPGWKLRIDKRFSMICLSMIIFHPTDNDAVLRDWFIWRNWVTGRSLHSRIHCKEVRIWRRCFRTVAKHSCKLQPVTKGLQQKRYFMPFRFCDIVKKNQKTYIHTTTTNQLLMKSKAKYFVASITQPFSEHKEDSEPVTSSLPWSDALLPH